MQYRQLGRSGLKVSPICLGTMMFGGPTDEATSAKIIAKAHEAGVNFIDTADAYSKGGSEEVVGRTIVFHEQLAQEGRLGFWRWLSLFLGVAGTYRRHDTIDIVYDRAGQRSVASVQPTVR